MKPVCLDDLNSLTQEHFPECRIVQVEQMDDDFYRMTIIFTSQRHGKRYWIRTYVTPELLEDHESFLEFLRHEFEELEQDDD